MDIAQEERGHAGQDAARTETRGEGVGGREVGDDKQEHGGAKERVEQEGKEGDGLGHDEAGAEVDGIGLTRAGREEPAEAGGERGEQEREAPVAERSGRTCAARP